jgi:alkylation response protein AidB-like acyl-CoA dehydrogenase
VGGAKRVLATCIKYAKERKAFGSAIAEFGAIQQKLAEMAIRIYAAESIVWRSVGLVESRLRGFSWDQPNASQTMLKAVEEFATECSIVKVYCSEMLDHVVDEGVQIHGGYGFHQDYAVERAYRDSRINRIFEGTNEINRLLIPGMLLKRDARGQLALLAAGDSVLDESTASDEEGRLVRNAKKIVLLSLAAAHRKYPDGLDKQQEILMHIADMMIETYAMESALLRSRKVADLEDDRAPGVSHNMAAVLLRDGMGRIEMAARNVLAASSSPGSLQRVRRLASYEPVDAIALRRLIARRLLQAERYSV